MIYPTLDEVLYVAKRTLKIEVQVRDVGLLASAVARPQTSAFGEDAYIGIAAEAAALMQSLTSSHALVDGNHRLALAAALAFLGLNGWRLTCPTTRLATWSLPSRRGSSLRWLR